MRAVFFGAGSPASLAALEALAGVATVTAVVVPPPATLRQRLSQRRTTVAFRRFNADQGLRVLPFGADFGDCDLICVAAFPRLIPRAMRSRARLGAVNVHASLLPRHRGPDPLFWTYFDDDRVAGVTLHWMTDGVDDGDVIAQQRIELPRGASGFDLYHRLAGSGAALVREHVPRIETAARVPQDPDRATHEPSPSRLTWHIDYDSWSAERLWHFLRGMEHRGFALPDRFGRFHVIGPIERFENVEHDFAPGTIVGNRVFARDGEVRWSRPPWLRSLRHALRRTPSR